MNRFFGRWGIDGTFRSRWAVAEDVPSEALRRWDFEWVQAGECWTL